jgi:hypothetical protein
MRYFGSIARPAMLLALLAGGCSSSEPTAKLSPAEGKIVIKGGGSLAGGTVEFIPVEGIYGAAVGEIAADGSYKLQTAIQGKRRDGAMPGTYNVVINPPVKGENLQNPIEIKQTVTIPEGGGAIPPIEVFWQRK